MTVPIHPFRDLRKSILSLILLVAIAGISGCASHESSGGMSSPPDWMVVPSGGQHAKSATRDYTANGGSVPCTECHGADLSGGTSKVSCFGNPAGCHHGPASGWIATSPGAQIHGVSAKQASGGSGFVSCQICHGGDFSGGGANVPCFTCHGVSAPHAPRPWRGSPYTHTDTAEAGNAPVCYQCHAYTGTANPNNPHVPPSPASAGTAPGCFNGTMCHNVAGHPAGWAAAAPADQPHGDAAKRDATIAGQGLPDCRICHGSSFSGGTSGVSCFTCHGVSAPHAPKPWRGSPYTHTDTAEAGNAPVCYQCHAYTGTANPNNPHVPPSPASAGTAPGCFNGTMCHNVAGHPAGWATAAPAVQPHGDAAKKDATIAGQGLPDCRICHGSSFSGGTSGVSCFTCHGVSAPHAPKPWRAISGSPYTHTNTAEAWNAPVCYQCHAYTGTANPNNPHVPPSPSSAGTAPGCFNGTMCHNETGHAVPFNTTTHYSVTNATFMANCGPCHAVTGTSPVSGAPLCTTCHAAGSPLTSLGCTSCHANPPSGATTAYPNAAGAHAPHIALGGAGTPIACDTCHNGLGTNTLNHYNRANARPGEDALRVPPGNVAFPATYSAKTGASSFDNSAPLNCSNVSCHGGQTTPNWQTGTIDVPNACPGCHISGTTQYNSFFSGHHDTHIVKFGLSAATCKLCHDVAKVNVSGHFQNLATPSFEQTARGTILSNVLYIGSNCNPRTGGLTGCHGSRKW